MIIVFWWSINIAFHKLKSTKLYQNPWDELAKIQGVQPAEKHQLAQVSKLLFFSQTVSSLFCKDSREILLWRIQLKQVKILNFKFKDTPASNLRARRAISILIFHFYLVLSAIVWIEIFAFKSDPFTCQ